MTFCRERRASSGRTRPKKGGDAGRIDGNRDHLIETLDPKLNAVVIRDFDRARARARESVSRGPFGGVPISLRISGRAVKGCRSQNSLPFRKDYVSPSDSEMVRKIKASGLNILGRTNVPRTGMVHRD